MFIKNHAKFTATMGKGIKVGDADVEIKLMLPLKVVQENFMFLSTNQGEKINVIFGDPQASMDFGEDNEDMYRVFTGRRVTAEASGIVTHVESHNEDPNQGNLFVENPEEGNQPAEEGNNTELEEQTGESSDTDTDVKSQNEDEGNLQSELPDWMQEGNGSNGDKEMDFEDPLGPNGEDKYNDGAKDEGESNEQNSSGADPAVVIDKDELENYILTNRPTFEDIPFDFPSLLKQRKEDGKTWMDISKETGVPSTQISSKYSAYKKRVTQMMKDGGAA
ncbi:hypothetical protein PMSD_00400 [Paenibacillus macquariensis subsp. defensor]|nr:hypothetical protein PMSD_00400 [Paenibacillus macquariensis subsp. defensor]